MKFRSRRDLFVSLVIYGAIVIMFAPLFQLFERKLSAGEITMVLFILAIAARLLWILHGTMYTIGQTHIIYQSGPLKGKFEIEKVHTVMSGKNLFIGFRPATALKGVIIKYGKYDEIYFSPDSNEAFIAELVKTNPGIKVERHKKP